MGGRPLDHINEYIKAVAGEDFSAKDFRTWHGTVLAAVGLAVSGARPAPRRPWKRAISRTVKEVAYYLGNTPAVCRASYIDPRVFDRYRDGITIGGALDQLGDVDLASPRRGAPSRRRCSISSRSPSRRPSRRWPETSWLPARLWP